MKQVVLSDPVGTGDLVPLEGSGFHHLVHVRRSGEGDPVIVLSGARRFHACIERVERRRCFLRVGEALREAVHPGSAAGPEPGAVHVYMAALKGNRFDSLLRGLTEIGVASIGVVSTERSVARISAEQWERRLPRYRAIVTEAVEQCGRLTEPRLLPPLSLRALPERVEPGIVFHERGYPVSLDTLVPPGNSGTPSTISLLIGPEGGFSDGEITVLRDHKWRPVTLPLPVLRAETAVLVLSALVTLLMNRYSIDS